MTQVTGEDRVYEQGPKSQVPKAGTVSLVGLKGAIERMGAAT